MQKHETPHKHNLEYSIQDRFKGLITNGRSASAAARKKRLGFGSPSGDNLDLRASVASSKLNYMSRLDTLNRPINYQHGRGPILTSTPKRGEWDDILDNSRRNSSQARSSSLQDLNKFMSQV